MKNLLLASLLLLTACTLPTFGGPTPAPTSTATLEPSPVPAVPLQPTTEPGTEGNPVILALAPAAQPAQELLNAGENLAGRLQALTGYEIVTAAPASEAELVQALSIGNAHVALLSPYGYLLASRTGNVSALLSRLRDGQALYGAQFIARLDAGFDPYYDPARDENTEQAAPALEQFRDRKPCWSDPVSPSGYVVPFGVLKQAGITVAEPAFLEGQGTVVRAVYSRGICDFGATYIDARYLPALEEDYPDVVEKVAVIWQIPAIIPYETIVTSSFVNPEIRRSLLRAFIDIMNTPDGKLLIQQVYGIDSFQPADEAMYDQFRTTVDESGLDLNTLIK
jgi:phosphonate transport system substrate-binding protein